MTTIARMYSDGAFVEEQTWRSGSPFLEGVPLRTAKAEDLANFRRILGPTAGRAGI